MCASPSQRSLPHASRLLLIQCTSITSQSLPCVPEAADLYANDLLNATPPSCNSARLSDHTNTCHCCQSDMRLPHLNLSSGSRSETTALGSAFGVLFGPHLSRRTSARDHGFLPAGPGALRAGHRKGSPSYWARGTFLLVWLKCPVRSREPLALCETVSPAGWASLLEGPNFCGATPGLGRPVCVDEWSLLISRSDGLGTTVWACGAYSHLQAGCIGLLSTIHGAQMRLPLHRCPINSTCRCRRKRFLFSPAQRD